MFRHRWIIAVGSIGRSLLDVVCVVSQRSRIRRRGGGRIVSDPFLFYNT